MNQIICPHVETNKEIGLIPHVNLPANYKELALRFSQDGGQSRLEDFAKVIEQVTESIFGRTEVRLQWDDENNGVLKNISVGIHGGFDLNERGIPHFQSHNLGGRNSLYAFTIATRYVSELLKAGN